MLVAAAGFRPMVCFLKGCLFELLVEVLRFEAGLSILGWVLWGSFSGVGWCFDFVGGGVLIWLFRVVWLRVLFWSFVI